MFNINTKTIRSLLVKVLYNDRNIPQIWVVHSRNYTSKSFSSLKETDSSEISAGFFTSVTEKMGLYTDIAKENIRYSKLSQDTRYGKLIGST